MQVYYVTRIGVHKIFRLSYFCDELPWAAAFTAEGLAGGSTEAGIAVLALANLLVASQLGDLNT